MAGGAWRVVGDFGSAAQLWMQQMELAYALIEPTGRGGVGSGRRPARVPLKMEHSTFCQGWLPHLSTEERCRSCSTTTASPATTRGSRTSRPRPTRAAAAASSSCRAHASSSASSCGYRIDIQGGAVPCHQCGAPLTYPVGVDQLSCPYCRTQTGRV